LKNFWFDFERKSLNWNSFGKGRKQRKPSYLSGPAAQRPTNPSPRQPMPPSSFTFLFLSLTTGPHRSASSPPPSFLLLLLCFARPGADAIPATSCHFPLPFLLTRADQLRQLTTSDQIGRYPFLKPLPEMAAASNGKRRPPPKPSASPCLLLSWLLFNLEPELLLPLCLHFASTHAQATLPPLPPPRLLGTAVN
jgi:hypothetical protein